MDGRIDRVRYKDGEERCDIYCEGNAMMEELEAKRHTYVQDARKEYERQDRSMDSGIDIPSSSGIRLSSVPRHGLDSSDGPFPSSPPIYLPSRTAGLDQGFAAEPIGAAEREEFQAQQMQRQQQRLQVQAQR
jgi:hypothetical protein